MDTFSTIAGLFGVTAILSFLNDRFLRLQQDIGLLLLASLTTGFLRIVDLYFLDASIVTLLRGITQSFNLNETLLKGVLCFLLFRGSVRVSWLALREQRWLVLWLAFVGTLLACLVTGWLVYASLTAFGVAISPAQAFLFGALIAATDPVAALAILSKVGLPKNLEIVVDGESLLNDGVAVVLFTVFAGMAIGSHEASLGEAGAIFLKEVLGGVMMGVLGWLVIHRLLLRSTTYCTSLLLSLGAVSSMYAAAQHLQISGPIATVVAGLLTGNLSAPRLGEDIRAPLGTFWSGLDEVLNSLLFVFVGLHVILITPLQGVAPGIPGLVAIIAVLLGRAFAVSSIVAGLNRIHVIRAELIGLTKLLTWGGLRGGLSLALAVSLAESPWKPLMLNMTFSVVIFSIIVQGLTIRRMFTQERLARLLR